MFAKTKDGKYVIVIALSVKKLAIERQGQEGMPSVIMIKTYFFKLAAQA